jgi:hypothetical protein
MQMRGDLMTWFKLSDHFYDHPKVMKAGNAPIGLWVRCCTYSANQRSDGRVPMEVAHTYGTTRDIERLTAAGLWVPGDDEYWIPNFLAYNPSRAQLEERAEAALKRQQLWRDKHRSNGDVTP